MKTVVDTKGKGTVCQVEFTKMAITEVKDERLDQKLMTMRKPKLEYDK